jgi:ribosomal protein L36
MIAAVQDDSFNAFQSWKLTTNTDEICRADDQGAALFVNSLEELRSELEIKNPAPLGLYYVIPNREEPDIIDTDTLEEDYEDYDDYDKNLPYNITKVRILVSSIPLADDIQTAFLYADQFDEIGIDIDSIDTEDRPKHYRKRSKLIDVDNGRPFWDYKTYQAAVIDDSWYLDGDMRDRRELSGYNSAKRYFLLKKDPDVAKEIKKLSKRKVSTTESSKRRRLKKCCLSAKTLKNLHKGMVAAALGFEVESAVPVKCKKDEVIKRLASLYALCKRLRREYRDSLCGKRETVYTYSEEHGRREWVEAPRPPAIELIRTFYPYTKSLLQHSNPDYILLGKWFAYEQKKDKKLAKAIEAAEPAAIEPAAPELQSV